MMRILGGLFLGIHGFAHLVGFVVPWKLRVPPDAPYKTTLLAGRIDIGDAAMRGMGLWWLATASRSPPRGLGS